MPTLYGMGYRNECCVTDIMSVQQFLPLTSKCDLDLGATDLGLARDTSSHDSQIYFCQVISKPSRKSKVMDPTQKKTLFLTFDL